MISSKLENLEAIALITIIMANKIILNIPKSIIVSTGSSAWITTIYISIIAILFAYFITLLFKNFSCSDILDVSKYLGGNKLKVIIGFLHIFLLLIVSILMLRNFSETLKVIYFNESPLLFLLIFFVITACIANKFGIKVIAKVNLIIAPAIFISILIILFAMFKDFVPQRLLPILRIWCKTNFF